MHVAEKEEENILKKNKRKRATAAAAIPHGARGGKSRFHSSARPISRMPAGCVYFVSFYITRYPRDLDSIYFLLALRLECTSPALLPSTLPLPTYVFDVEVVAFLASAMIALDFSLFPFSAPPFSSLLSLSASFLFPQPSDPFFPSGTLASFNRDITLHTPTANYDPKQHHIRSTFHPS